MYSPLSSKAKYAPWVVSGYIILGHEKSCDLVLRQHSLCDFSTSESWVILSPIEQSIKRKIEAVGTPLKDWDIQINYGIKTGCNEAFIITTEKRNEILANCQTEEERARTEELIRPILRGRDIKRYGYNWAGLWLINAHNGIKGKLERIHIEEYPALKAHLDQFKHKLEERSDKGDTPYNLRNCAYLLKKLRQFLFCFPATTDIVLCLFSDFEKRRMFVSTVALSNIFKPAKSRSSFGSVFCAKKALVFSP